MFVTLCEDEQDRLRLEPSRDEREDQGGSVVEPVSVVHEADERLRLGDVGEQRQNREADEERIRLAARRSHPKAVRSASPCGAGRPSTRSRNGMQSW